MRRIGAIWTGLLIAGLLPAAAGAVTAGEKCEAAKLKAAGKYTFCRMKAESKAIKTSTAPDYGKCDEKYGDKWTVVESKAGGACPVTGDAATVQTQATDCTDGLAATIGGAARFADNADGTITDNETGLMWEKKTELNGGANFANLHDADNQFRWSGTCTVATSKRCQPTAAAAALCAANVEGNPDGCAECTGGDGTCNQATTMWTVIADLNTASFAGHSDWRAPTRQELEAILDLADTTPPVVNAAFHGASCGAACTDITSAACSCTQSDAYWSVTTYAPSTDVAWFVYFHDGYVYATVKPGYDLYVRPVRGAS